MVDLKADLRAQKKVDPRAALMVENWVACSVGQWASS